VRIFIGVSGWLECSSGGAFGKYFKETLDLFGGDAYDGASLFLELQVSRSIAAILAACAASTVLVAGAVSAPAPLDDPTIVAIFDEANTADIETGTLAVERGQSREVRDYGAMLVRDHKVVRQMGRDLAQKLGVTPTPPADDTGARAHAEAMARLRKVPAADFDRTFLAHEVAFHQAVIDAINSTLLPAISNAELKALVVKVAPAFEGHRDGAATIAKKLKDGK
jgi:putative membrane protein